MRSKLCIVEGVSPIKTVCKNNLHWLLCDLDTRIFCIDFDFLYEGATVAQW